MTPRTHDSMQPATGAQIASARVATEIAVVGVGVRAPGFVAIRRPAIRRLKAGSGSIERLRIAELEVDRLRVKQLMQDA